MPQATMQNERIDNLDEEQLGQEWIRAIKDGALDRLRQFSSPQVTSRLLLPGGLVTLHNAADLVGEYRSWFGGYTSIQVEASRVGKIGSKLGIYYRLLLQDGRASERIEQQLYCIVKDGHVQLLHLVCSGFHPVDLGEPLPAAGVPGAEMQDPTVAGLP